MKRERVQMKDSCCPSIKPANAESIFAPRPFAPKVEEREAPAPGPGIDFNFADISILPRETVRPKLVLGPVGDKYEQEADRVARQVVDTISSSERGAVQRQDLEDENELDLEETMEEEKELQRKVDVSSAAGGADVGPDLESAIHRARSSGQPLSDRVRQPMERAFGADFGGVRVHADDQADRLNRSIQARAFTTGQDIFLRQGEYRPGSSGGQRLLAHELTHVVQQNKKQINKGTHLASLPILGRCPSVIQRSTSITLYGEEDVKPTAEFYTVAHTRASVSNYSKQAAKNKDWSDVPLGAVCNHSVSYDRLLLSLTGYAQFEEVKDYCINVLYGLYSIFYNSDPKGKSLEVLDDLNDDHSVDRDDLVEAMNYLIYKICDAPDNLFYWPQRTGGDPDFPTDISASGVPMGWTAKAGLDLTGVIRRRQLEEFGQELERTVGNP